MTYSKIHRLAVESWQRLTRLADIQRSAGYKSTGVIKAEEAKKISPADEATNRLVESNTSHVERPVLLAGASH